MRVLARAYGDRPLDRIATGATGGLVYLLNPAVVNSGDVKAMSGVGFPEWSVFGFDAALFDSLQAAWTRGDSAAVKELWVHAQPADLAEVRRL